MLQILLSAISTTLKEHPEQFFDTMKLALSVLEKNPALVAALAKWIEAQAAK